MTGKLITAFTDATAVTSDDRFLGLDGSSTKLHRPNDVADYAADRLGIFNVKKYGAVGDGVTDDTAAFQAASAAIAGAGGGVMYIPGGTFYINSAATATPIDIPSNCMVVGVGRQSLMKRGPSYSQQMIFRISGASNVTVRDTACDFNNAAQFFRYVGLRDAAPSDVRLERNRVFDSNPDLGTSGDKWAFNLSVGSGTIENLWIVGNHSSNDMQLTSGGKSFKNVWITDNVVEGSRTNGIALTQLGDSTTFENISITANRVYSPVGIGIIVGPDDNATARSSTTGRNIEIRDNTIHTNDAADDPIGIEVRAFNTQQNIRVTGNRVIEVSGSTNIGTGIRVTTDTTLTPGTVGSGVLLSNNVVDGYQNGVVVRLHDKVNITGNTIRNSTSTLMRVHECSGVSIVGNYCDTSSGGVEIKACEKFDVRGNTIEGVSTGFSAHLLITGDSAARFATMQGTVAANRLGPKSGSNTVYGIRQAGTGSFNILAYLNDVTGTNGVDPAAGSFTTRWMNEGDAGTRISIPRGEWTATATWDPPSVAAGSFTSTTIAVSGAAAGDVVSVSHTAMPASSLVLSAFVDAAGSVRVVIYNPTGGAIDVPSGQLRAVVRRVA